MAKFEVPEGGTAQAYRFALAPSLAQVRAFRSHAGAARKAYNTMRSAGGARKRGLNRALADAALAEARRMLSYKARWYGSVLVEADRYYPSSKLCSGCGRRKPNLTLADQTYACNHCGLRIDRDLNAAANLARLGETSQRELAGEKSPAGSSPVAGRGATRETEPARAGDAGGCETSTPRRRPPGKTGTASPQGEAA